MTRKQDITAKGLDDFDKILHQAPEEAIKNIHDQANDITRGACEWYWRSIQSKRLVSQILRGFSFILAGLGSLSPLVAAFNDTPDEKFVYVQVGILLLAVAGLLQVADRIFGYSSGWIRYITTVSAMEAARQRFEIDFTGHALTKAQPLDAADVVSIYTKAKKLVDEVLKLQNEETKTWCTEFSSSVSALADFVQSQRDSVERELMSLKETAEQKEKEREGQPGGIEMTIVHAGEPEPVEIELDGGDSESFNGTVWAETNLSPGYHKIKITYGETPEKKSKKIIVEVKARA